MGENTNREYNVMKSPWVNEKGETKMIPLETAVEWLRKVRDEIDGENCGIGGDRKMSLGWRMARDEAVDTINRHIRVIKNTFKI